MLSFQRRNPATWRSFVTKAKTSASKLYDVAIVGGGPVGNAMACALGKQDPGSVDFAVYFSGHSKWLGDKRVLLLESSQPKRLGSPPVQYSNRVFACSPASIQMFKGLIRLLSYISERLDLGIWETLANYRVKEIAGLYVYSYSFVRDYQAFRFLMRVLALKYNSIHVLEPTL